MFAPVRPWLARALVLFLAAGAADAVAAPQAAHAQHVAPPLPDAWDPPGRTTPSRAAASVDEVRRDYRWVGTAVGAAALGIAAALEAAAACGNSEHGPRDCTGVTIGVGALGAVVGGTAGHFVGRLFRRS